jgi:hypothetical protein
VSFDVSGNERLSSLAEAPLALKKCAATSAPRGVAGVQERL